MKILKEGNKKLVNYTLEFTCDKCGCIFEADKNECFTKEYNGIFHSGFFADTLFPFCKRTVSMYVED